MLILLPPSEGKAVPRRGRPLDLSALRFPGLTDARERVLDALVRFCEDDPDKAAETLDVPKSQHVWVERNAWLRTAATARADQVYTGVLYEALDAATLSTAAKRRTGTRVAITSALFGLVRLADRIPAYRLSGDSSLPDIGKVAGLWRDPLGPAVGETIGDGLLVDLRSTMYAAFWRPPAEWSPRVATLRVMQMTGGRRQVVSHHNKATKGRIVRDLLESGATPRTPAQLAAALHDLGWMVEPNDPTRQGTVLDVVVTDPAAR